MKPTVSQTFGHHHMSLTRKQTITIMLYKISLFCFIFLSVLGVCHCVPGCAQTILSQNFESGMVPVLPPGWMQATKATTGWETDTSSFKALSSGWVINKSTTYAIIDEGKINEDNDSTVLKSPIFSLVGKTGCYLSFDYYFKGQLITSPATKTEKAYVRISTDGGTIWKNIDTIKGDPTKWQKRILNLAAYDNMSNLQIAFFYSDDGAQMQGIAIDNIKVYVPFAVNATVDAIILPRLSATDMIAAAGVEVSTVITNSGTVPISFDIQYAIDGGKPVIETYPATIPPLVSTIIYFTAPMGTVTAGVHNLTVSVTNVNGGTDEDTSDNQLTSPVLTPSKSTSRAGLIEDFASSTCFPCAAESKTVDTILVRNRVNDPASDVNVIKYQMDFPGPSNDPSFNTHSASRKAYYDVHGIPRGYTNGMRNSSFVQNQINWSKLPPAYMTLNGDYVVGEDSIYISVSATPHFIMSTANCNIYAALVENNYRYDKAYTSQKDYVYVMRKMYPDGDGTTVSNWTDGKAVNLSFSDKFLVGNVAQGNFNFWTHPKNSALIIFVQDSVSKIIYQSHSVPARFPTAIRTASGNITEFSMYPNPASNVAYIAFNTTEHTKIKILVLDAVGRIVENIADNIYQPGVQQMALNTGNLSPGIYTIKLETEKGAIIKQLSVVK